MLENSLTLGNFIYVCLLELQSDNLNMNTVQLTH